MEINGHYSRKSLAIDQRIKSKIDSTTIFKRSSLENNITILIFSKSNQSDPE